MNYFTKAMALFVGLMVFCTVSAQDANSLRFEKRYTLYFRVNSNEIDRDYMNNSETIAKMQEELGMVLDNPQAIDSLILFSTASPEGSYARNKALSRDRSKMVKTIVEELFPKVDPSRVTVGAQIDEDWQGLIELVENDLDLYGRDQILEVLRSTNSSAERKARLAALENGKISKNLYKTHCDDLRYCVIVVKVVMEMPQTLIASSPIRFAAPETALKVNRDTQIAPIPSSFNSHITLKTNTLGWVITGANVAVEVDLAKHFSFSVPFYYSGGLDYFKETIKFRGIVLQPELRYYPTLTQDLSNGGFFVGAHFGLGWYNFALNQDFRIQDHGGNRPAYGGGLGLGYVHKFKKNPRWGMEFILGGGVYDVLYDTFYNENNGPYDEKAVHDIWFGIDNAAVSFTYNFNLNKGGKK